MDHKKHTVCIPSFFSDMQSFRPVMLTLVTRRLPCSVDEVSDMNQVKRNKVRGLKLFTSTQEFNTSKIHSCCANACCEEHDHPNHALSGTANGLILSYYEHSLENHLGSFLGTFGVKKKTHPRLVPFELSTQTANRTKMKSVFLLG